MKSNLIARTMGAFILTAAIGNGLVGCATAPKVTSLMQEKEGVKFYKDGSVLAYGYLFESREAYENTQLAGRILAKEVKVSRLGKNHYAIEDALSVVDPLLKPDKIKIAFKLADLIYGNKDGKASLRESQKLLVKLYEQNAVNPN